MFFEMLGYGRKCSTGREGRLEEGSMGRFPTDGAILRMPSSDSESSSEKASSSSSNTGHFVFI